MKIEMNKKQVLQDLETLQSKFRHVVKYYPLSDKDLTSDNFNNIIQDLKEYLTEKL